MSWRPRTLPASVDPFDVYLFGRGEHWSLYRFLGAHKTRADGRDGYRFAAWAPNAKGVSLIGDFNDWTPGEHPLYPEKDSGLWSAFAPDIPAGTLYKLAIHDLNGRIVFKADPFAFRSEAGPGAASVTWTLDNHAWGDGDWLAERARRGAHLDAPLSLYEVHAGSWRRRNGSEPLSYGELADSLVPYARDMGFTHIELLPFAGSPGAPCRDFYAPAPDFGLPEDLKSLVERCHAEGLGVILDWDPGSFSKVEQGLGRFDGTALYEHADPRLGELPDESAHVFDLSRPEVRNFLLANALYWLGEFHLDGLRLPSVSRMLYLDYDRPDGGWLPNRFGGPENIQAVRFLQELNTVTRQRHPGALVVAEENSSWAGVSRPAYVGGLGFSYQWNSAWAKDSLGYFSQEPELREPHHDSLTFSMLYAFSENYVLPLSHETVGEGQGALLARMPGDPGQKLANLRLLYAYQWAHPGKKLLFMGCELGQWKPWREHEELDWPLLDDPAHQGIRRLVSDLNRIYRDIPAAHAHDCEWTGFEWVDLSDCAASVLGFVRKDGRGGELLWIFNFRPQVRTGYAIGCRTPGRWRELFNSDSAIYGGTDIGNGGGVTALEGGEGAWPFRLVLTLPPLGALALVPA